MTYQHDDHCQHRFLQPQCRRCHEEAVAGAAARRIDFENLSEDATRWREFKKWARAQGIASDKVEGTLESLQDTLDGTQAEKRVLEERVEALLETVERLEAALHHRRGQARR